jgi:hypothetical protein
MRYVATSAMAECGHGKNMSPTSGVQRDGIRRAAADAGNLGARLTRRGKIFECSLYAFSDYVRTNINAPENRLRSCSTIADSSA